MLTRQPQKAKKPGNMEFSSVSIKMRFTSNNKIQAMQIVIKKLLSDSFIRLTRVLDYDAPHQ